MTNMQMFWAAVWRFIRVALGQVIGLLITQTTGINIPYIGISIGAVISMVCKFLRDKYGWDWLPL